MATQTVVCPECGVAAAPGRYTCAACGAFLDGVAVRPRDWTIAEPAPAAADGTSEPEPQPQPEPETAFAPMAGAAAVPGAAPVAEPTPGIAAARTPAYQRRGSAIRPEGATFTGADDGWDPVEPDDPADMAVEMPAAPAAPADATLPAAAAVPMDGPVATPAVAPVVVPEFAPMPAPASGPVWPEPGQRAELPVPEPRAPAGTYLPPSAVLDTVQAPVVAAVATPSAAMRPSASGAATAIARPRGFALPDLSAGAERLVGGSRRAVAIGATVAAIGFVLPWSNVPASTLVTLWLQVWGLAGPGHWIVVAGLLVVAAIASSWGPIGLWPIGVAAIAFATLALGLIWPYVFSGLPRPLGVWFVLAGAIALGVGGVVQVAARHEAATPRV